MNLYDAFMTPRERADLLNEMSQKGFFRENEPFLPTAAKPQRPPERPPERPMPPMGECIPAPSLAMVYSPRQSFRGLYSPMEALSRGTLFEELDKPLMAVKGGKR